MLKGPRAAWLLLLAAPSVAQMAAFRDLTSGWRPPSDHISVPQSCDKPQSTIADDDEARAAGAKKTTDLELTIVSTTPAALGIDDEFTAIVRLKNVGSQPVMVPAITDGEQIMRTSAEGNEETYEVGDITFRLATDPKHTAPVFLSSAGALFANPNDASSYVTLKPGNWLELKLRGAVQCGAAQCLGGIQPDNKAVLSAWWYQRLLTHRISGCEETHGSHNIRELDSLPFSVEVRNPPAKTSSMARKF